MLNWWGRYAPIIRALPADTGTVLDVGAGHHGLSWYWPGTVVQTDLRFTPDRNHSEDPRAGRAIFAAADVTRLPFCDLAFSTTVCSDMLEHLPPAQRGPALAELARVTSRRLIVAFPAGRVAQAVDRTVALALRARGQQLPAWLEEHFAHRPYPRREDIVAALPDGWTARRARSGNAILQTLLVLAELTGPGAHLGQRLERHARRRHLWPRVADLGPAYRAVLVCEPTAARPPQDSTPWKAHP